ncbi:hypothetical protein HYALB_00009435 [Hymenoscyphus albidus]|uniref:DUF7025 domain-containing protein n=1 Tax=Hymenoscyphus albidus TaxID=595503 RepID=A0A9N9Q1N1_9HELO|nr:hypothetical protein HYALB_00009435 [Hymenoscyphus albidus]
MESLKLYRADDRSIWDTWTPAKNRADDVEAESYSQECALIVRREPHPSNTNQAALHSITIQSPLIKKILDVTFEGFEGLNTQLKQLTFKAPFHPFYYRCHRFEKLRRDEKDEETKSHVDLLYDTLSKEICPHIEVMEDYTKNGVISFEYLWILFAPGMELYAMIDGHDRIILLRDSRYGASMSGEYFSLECKYIECDGSTFGYVDTSIEINSFHGVKKLVDLDAIPSHLRPDISNLIGRLYKRGNKLESLNGFHHMSYSGFYTARSSRQVRKRYVEKGRIVIDANNLGIYAMPGPNLEALECISLSIDDDNMIYKATSRENEIYQNVLKDYENKKTAEFDVENVHLVRWSENAFSRLVLPHGYKDIIHAFVQEQLSRDDEFDDIITGKGIDRFSFG